MQYIKDKNLYKAVMFYFSMCGHDLQGANDSKITVAANYYKVDHDEVLKIVKNELWNRAKKEACQENGWYTVYNPHAPELLGTGFGNDFVWICPNCNHVQAANVHDDFRGDRIFVSSCPACGWFDRDQRYVTRKEFYKRYVDRGFEGTLDASRQS